MTKPTPIRIKAWLVTYHTSHGPGALLFCSRICEDAALEPFDRPGQTVRFSEHVARAEYERE
jgi:hypothetical protein